MNLKRKVIAKFRQQWKAERRAAECITNDLGVGWRQALVAVFLVMAAFLIEAYVYEFGPKAVGWFYFGTASVGIFGLWLRCKHGWKLMWDHSWEALKEAWKTRKNEHHDTTPLYDEQDEEWLAKHEVANLTVATACGAVGVLSLLFLLEAYHDVLWGSVATWRAMSKGLWMSVVVLFQFRMFWPRTKPGWKIVCVIVLVTVILVGSRKMAMMGL